MPVGQPTSARELRAVAIALVGVLIAVGLGFGMLRLARGGNVDIRLGDDVYDAGRIGRISQEIKDGGPILYPDLVGGTREIYVNHLGDDPETDWYAIAARPAGAAAECIVEWTPDASAFVNPCDGTAYPPNGAGLETYPVQVRDGRVLIDLNRISELDSSTSETAPDTSDGIVRSGIPRDE